MTKKILAMFLLLLLCGCGVSAETAETEQTAEFIPNFSPEPIIDEAISSDGALSISVKLHGDEYPAFNHITALVTITNNTDKSLSYAMDGGIVTEIRFERQKSPLEADEKLEPLQTKRIMLEFEPKTAGEYIFYTEMVYVYEGENRSLRILPRRLKVIPQAKPYYIDPSQDYKSLPYMDDFSDDDFTYRYLNGGPNSNWIIKNDSLYVYSGYDPDRLADGTIGNYYYWSYYTASIDFKLAENGKMKMSIYQPQNAKEGGEVYYLAIDSAGNWYAGDSFGVGPYERGQEIYRGELVTGVFEDFNPDVWNRVSMISKDGKLYISLNSGESIYICDLDPNSVGAVYLSGSTGTAFDNLEVVSGEYNL
jgi:hypothetical protein